MERAIKFLRKVYCILRYERRAFDQVKRYVRVGPRAVTAWVRVDNQRLFVNISVEVTNKSDFSVGFHAANLKLDATGDSVGELAWHRDTADKGGNQEEVRPQDMVPREDGRLEFTLRPTPYHVSAVLSKTDETAFFLKGSVEFRFKYGTWPVTIDWSVYLSGGPDCLRVKELRSKLKPTKESSTSEP